MSSGFVTEFFESCAKAHTEKKGEDGMDPAEERATGARNEEYNLVSVLYHALHGAETCEMYALDAEAAGNDELASFFRNVQATHRQVAEQAKTRLYTGHVAMSAGSAPPEEGRITPEEISGGRHAKPPPQGGISPEEISGE